MTIDVAYRRTTYLLSGMGFLSLIITGEVPIWLIVMIVATLIITYGNDDRKEPINLSTQVWNIFSLIFFVYEFFMAIYSDRELILNVMEFLVILQIVRLWQRKADRDYLQIFGLSLLHLIAAAVLTAELTYSVVFICYIIAGTWALVVFNLQRELKGELRETVRNQNLVTGKFLFTLSLVSLVVFIFSILIFIFFPRLNYNYFASFLKKTTPQSGFSEKVRLGEIGKIKLNKTPVMRITLSGPKADQFNSSQLYLRGVALSEYDGQQWRVLTRRDREMVTTHNYRYFNLTEEPLDRADLVQEIVLEPLGNDVLFVLPKVMGLKTPFGIISHRNGDNFLGSFAGAQRVKYTVYSKLEPSNEPRARDSQQSVKDQAYDWEAIDEYLQIPFDIDSRIYHLASSLTRNLDDNYDRAKTIEQYLRTQLGYTLEMKDSGDQDPLAFFLFERKKGHCEYFASSMAIMLRTLGIPTRMINGYYHGEYNSVGNFHLIRESHAHTWVEVLFPDSGWIRFDPTPADPQLNFSVGVFDRFRYLFETAQLMWVNWVVDYNLQQQRDAYFAFSGKRRRLQRKTKRRVNDIKSTVHEFFGRFFDPRKIQSFLMIGVILVSSGLFFYFLRQWVKNQSHGRRALSVPFYDKMLHLLKRQGFERPPAYTPLEFSRWLRKKVSSNLALRVIEELTELFCKIRYGGFRLDPPLRKKVDRQLKELHITLKNLQ